MKRMHNGFFRVKTGEGDIYFVSENGLKAYDVGELHDELVPVKLAKGEGWRFFDSWGELSADSYPMIKWVESVGAWAVEDLEGWAFRDSYGNVSTRKFLEIQDLIDSAKNETPKLHNNGFQSFSQTADSENGESEM